MRLALKNTLALLATYLLVVGVVGWWMLKQLDELSHNVVTTTVRVVGTEMAKALTDSALQQLREDDPAARQRLAEIVEQVTERSSILTSLAVVDGSGRVIAGDDASVGRSLALPALVFPDGQRLRMLRADGPFEQETVYVMVSLLENEVLAGYVRLGMRIERIARLYTRAGRNFVVVAVIGLLAIGLAGVLMHVQLSRRSRALARSLEDAARGVAPRLRRRDEFSSALAVAQQVGRELIEARGDRVQALQHLDALMKSLDVGVLIVESDGNLSFANLQAADLFGYEDTGALAAAWNADLRSIVRTMLTEVCDQPAGQRLEHEIPAGDRAAQLRLEFYAMGDGECPQVVLVRSSSSLDALQAELGLAIQMRGLTRFYAAFAHDLKAPLNAMVLNLELLKLSLPSSPDGADTEKRLRHVATLDEEIARLDRQLHTLLAHTVPPRDESGSVDLRNLLDLLVQLLAPQARHQGIKLSCALPTAPLVVAGHADRLKQALLNILINAVEAMPDGGELNIALEPTGGSARIFIRDNGPGIPPELLDSIYQMHFTTKNGGTGVGLYVARSVVQSHGGMIEVQSADGGGTAFTVILPLADAGDGETHHDVRDSVQGA